MTPLNLEPPTARRAVTGHGERPADDTPTVVLPELRKGARCRLTLDVTLNDDPRPDGRVWVETDEGTNMIVDRWVLEPLP